MEKSNSQNAGEVPEETSEIPIGNRSKNNIGDNKDSTQKPKEENSDFNKDGESQADELKKKGFEEKNKIMTGCTGAVIEEKDDRNSAASFKSSSNYRSKIPVRDSNATTKKMICPKRLTEDTTTDSTTGTPDPTKNDLATNLINTSPSSTSSLRAEDARSKNCAEVNKEKPRNADRGALEQLDLVSGHNAIHIANSVTGEASSERRNVLAAVAATTSEGERSVNDNNMLAEALTALAVQISVAAIKASQALYEHLDAAEDDNAKNEILHACLSSTESDEEIDVESLEESGVWTHKRKMDPHIIISSSAMSKHCMELRSKIAEAAAANQAKMVAPRPNSSGATSRGPPKIKRRYSRTPRGKNKADSSETSESSETSN